MSRYQFTSESVTEGHPDKLCDAVSRLRSSTPSWRRTRRRASPASRSRRPAWSSSPARSRRPPSIDVPTIVRRAVREIGYNDSDDGLRRQHVRRPHRRREAEPGHLAGRHRGRGPPQGAGRRRPGPHVRLRERRDARTSCPRRSTTRTSSRGSSRPSARAARSTSSAPTARPRSRSSTRTTCRCAVDAIVVSHAALAET